MPDVTITANLKKKKARADPGVLHISEGRLVEFLNDTDDIVRVVVFDHPQASGTIPKRTSRPLNFDGAGNGTYIYAAYCKVVDAFAEGKSSPKVIIP